MNKILLSAPVKVVADYIDSIKYSLEAWGHTVDIVDSTEFYRSCTYLQRKLYKLGFKSIEDRFNDNYKTKILNICSSNKYDIFLAINSNHMLTSSLIGDIRKLGIHTICWLLDGIIKDPSSADRLCYDFDRLFLFQKSDVEYISKKSSRHVLIGYDERYFFKKEMDRDIDVSFIGTPTPDRLPFLILVAEYCYKNNRTLWLQGPYYDNKLFWKKSKFVRKYPILSKYVHNGIVNFSQAADIYRKSKICLNINQKKHTEINPRTFEILATESFQLMNSGQSLYEILIPNYDFVEYDSKDELIKKIDWYLDHEIERNKIARQGYMRVRKKYRMTDALKDLI